MNDKQKLLTLEERIADLEDFVIELEHKTRVNSIKLDDLSMVYEFKN